MKALLVIAALGLGVSAAFYFSGAFERKIEATDFKPFSASAAAARSSSFDSCFLLYKVEAKAEHRDSGIRCMERLGYSFDPR